MEPITQHELDEKLDKAVRAANAEAVKKYIALGADVNARSTEDGMTPLVFCSHSVEPGIDIRKMLMEAGADPHLPGDNGRDAVGHICCNHLPGEKTLDVLFASGPGKADPNRADSKGALPLELARERDHIAVLLKYGADPFKKNAQGKTPIEIHAELKKQNNVSHMVEDVFTKLLIANDYKLDVRMLVDEKGQPTELLANLLKYQVPDRLANPSLYKNGELDVGEVFPFLPPYLQNRIDMAPYRRHKAELPESDTGEHVERYKRRSKSSDGPKPGREVS